MGWIGGNVFEAPHLPDDMLNEEKLFISIEKWVGDSYITTPEQLDYGTKKLLKKKPNGEGKYFSWRYITPEESEKSAAKDVAKEGFTTNSGEGSLFVYKEESWTAIEDEIHDKWYDEGLWE
jgi:hypothetical protein